MPQYIESMTLAAHKEIYIKVCINNLVVRAELFANDVGECLGKSVIESQKNCAKANDP